MDEIYMLKSIYRSEGRYIKGIFCATYYPETPQIRGQFIFLHGFPSWRTKNYDLAEVLASEGFIVHIPHYPGLGLSKGTFDFIETREKIFHFINEIKVQNPELKTSFLGHSWGGYLSLYYQELCDDMLILMAPLAKFPQGSKLEQLIDSLIQEAPEDCIRYDRDSFLTTFRLLENNLEIKGILKNMTAKKVYLFKAERDEVITPDLINDFSESNKNSKLQVVSIDDDHIFSKRGLFIKELLKYIK